MPRFVLTYLYITDLIRVSTAGSERVRGKTLIRSNRGSLLAREKMSSLITKISKTRSTTAPKSPIRKGKKAASAKTRPTRGVVTPKPKKRSLAPVSSKTKKTAAKKPTPKKPSFKKVAKPTAKTAARRAPVKLSRSKAQATVTKKSAVKTVPLIEKRIISPSAMQAIRAFERALTEFNRHQFDNAKTSFEALLSNFGDEIDIVARARTYLAICDQRLARTPHAPRNNADALYNQGVFEFNRGNIREAIDIFQKALKVNPRGDHILYSLAAAYVRALDPAKAMDALRRAIRMNPIHRSHARHDPDFSSLKGNREFQVLSGIVTDLSE